MNCTRAVRPGHAHSTMGGPELSEGEHPRADRFRVVRTLTAIAAVALALAACGGSAPVVVPEAVRPGYELARGNGCAACHGNNGQGGVGPSWIGLAGSEVELAGGRTVVADRQYLTRAIVDPGADKLSGYGVAMPTNDLDADEVDLIVDYIEALANG